MPAGAVALLAALALAAAPLDAQTPDRPRAFLLFIDDLHVDFRQTPRTRALMQRMLRDVAREGDIWAVATTGTSSLRLPPTTDLTALKTSVSRVTGNGLKPEERLLVPRGSNAAAEMRHRAGISYAAAVDAIRGLAAAPDTEWRAYLEAAQTSLRRLAGETAGLTIFGAEDVDPVVQRFAKP